MSSTTKAAIASFQKTVWNFYHTEGRHVLPWRKTHDPYKIHVSEVMLQQTQVDRVLPKYQDFIGKWPTVSRLAEATLRDVLVAWQGLGYNRRAKLLHTSAQQITKELQRKYPKELEGLVKLAGIGPYTAGAIATFAYNKPVVMIETNIRSVFIHHFFGDTTDVTDTEISQLVRATLDEKNPREWYWALMDYGSHLKKEFGNPNSKSRHYTKQSKFEGSDRQIRGAIVRELSAGKATRNVLLKRLNRFEDIRIDAQLEKLLVEGMLVKANKSYQLPE